MTANAAARDFQKWFSITLLSPANQQGKCSMTLEWQTASQERIRQQSYFSQPGGVRALMRAKGFLEKPGRPKK